MATWADVITDALQDLGAIQAGESPSAEDQAYCLSRLNRLLDQWSGERLQIPYITRTTWTIVANDGSYTVGSSGEVNIVRPIYVEGVSVLDTTTNDETPLEPMTDDQYRLITDKTATATAPSWYWYNMTTASSQATLVLYPIPTSSTLQGVMYAATALAQISSVSATATLAPGYKRMIETNLALEIAPGFDKQPSQSLMLQARDSMHKVKRINFRMRDLGFEPAVLGNVC